jgi:hypothetical protein
MSNSAETLITVPADIVEAVRTGLSIEEGAATEELQRNLLPAGHPDRYRRLIEAWALREVIDRKRPVTPAAVQVSLEKHRLPLLAALHGTLETDARELGKPNASRQPQERTRVIARLNALAEYISNLEALGGARDDTGRQLEERLEAQLERALTALGYDESRGDWWRVTYDGGEDGLGIKSEIRGEDKNFDVTTTGYTLP